MAKKKIFKGKEGGIPFQIRFDKDLYEKLRLQAFKKRISMAEIAREAIEEKLKEK